MPEWFDDDEFWAGIHPVIFSRERLAAAAAEVEALLALVPFNGASVLDLCCGPGRHAIPLARRGLRVTAVDRTAFFLDRGRRAARDEGVEVEWVQEDMRRFRREGAFDLIVSMFTSFGYFESEDDDLAVLHNLHASLRPGGALLIDVIGKEWLADHFQPTTSEAGPDGSLLVQRHEIYDDWSRVRNEWILIRDGSATTWRFSHAVYSGRELKDRLRLAGFGTVRLYGDLEGHPYGPDATRLVAVAVKGDVNETRVSGTH